jgi:hypothetical protein
MHLHCPARHVLPALFLLCAMGRAEDFADTAKLAGTWALDGKPTWKLAPTPDGVHFTYMHGSQTVADFECNTSGKDCPIKMDGKKTTVTVYFNGSQLVLMETRGSDVVKMRFGVLAASGEMQVETIPITASVKPETQRLKRVATESATR